MNVYLFSFLSGLIQGLTEFIPVSSSGHLAILHNAFGFSEPHVAFDVLLHSGTLAAVVAAYGKEIRAAASSAVSLLRKIVRREFRLGLCTAGERLCILMTVSTMPLAAGAFLADRLAAAAASTRAVGLLLILNAAILTAGDAAAKRTKRVPLASFGVKSAVLVGLLQFFAAAPGISRSGATIAGGLFSGLSREDAVKYSFILSVPATLGAVLLSLTELSRAESAAPPFLPCLLGTLTAAATGFLAIKLIKRISKRTNFGIFAAYCAVAGGAALAFG